jgi:Flp pilus assembly protein TadD
MFSSSRNSRKPYRALILTATVSLLLGQAVQAADPSHNFVLTAYSNGTGGAELISGNYAAAAEALHYPPSLTVSDASTTSNNRCVALAMTKQWDSARAACNQAVRDAQQEKAVLPSYQYWARKLQNDYLAVALSNRAVLHWMSSDSAAAANDLKRAAALSPKADFVAHNLAALEYSHSGGAVAQVSVAPGSPGSAGN